MNNANFIHFVGFCKEQHDVECNQKYANKLPYSFHLSMVEKQAIRFIDLIKDDNHVYLVRAACWGHDLIEDARVTYNDIVKDYGVDLAEIIYLCTEMRGRNRADRKCDAFYEELKTNELAVFVKLCNMIANVHYSSMTHSSMLDKYKDEYYKKVRPHLYCDKYKKMFSYLEDLMNL